MPRNVNYQDCVLKIYDDRMWMTNDESAYMSFGMERKVKRGIYLRHFIPLQECKQIWTLKKI
jgi:hypothetical protein